MNGVHGAVEIEVVDEGDAGGEFFSEDLFGGEILESHNDTAIAIAVGDDEDIFALFDVTEDCSLEEGKGAGAGVFE